MAASDAGSSSSTGHRVDVYSDGCYQPEDGSGGWAYVAYRDGVEIAADFGHVNRSSNNAMELTALLKAAIWINTHAASEPSVLWSDSVYAVMGSNRWRHVWRSRGWRKKGPDPKARSRTIPDRELWIAVDSALSTNGSLQVRWCKGHSGIPGNEKSDELADRGRLMTERDKAPQPLFPGYGPV